MQLVYRDDAYARQCMAKVTEVDERGIRLDATVFYPMGGGQPGDIGVLRLADGSEIPIVDTVKGAAAEDWARAGGYSELASDTELDNEAGRLAHAGCGFQEVGRAVKFRKSLRS